MKIVKNYKTFSDEYRLNENIFTKMWGAVIDYFRRKFGADSWIYYALYLQKNGQLPKSKVEFIMPEGYLKSMKNSVIPTEADIMNDIKAKFNKTDKEKEEEELDNALVNKFTDSTAGTKNVEPVKTEETPTEFEEESELELDNELEKEMESLDNIFSDDYIVEHLYLKSEDEKINEDFVTLKFPTEKDSKGEEIMTVRNVDVDELKKRIERVYKMNLLRAGRHGKEGYSEKGDFQRKKTHALFIWGAPGIGKTEILHQVAKSFDIIVQEWHLATIEPTDFRGIPKVENVIKGSTNPKDERTVSKLPSIFPTSDGNGKGGIMFFDELNRAPEMVLSASLALALSGKHGEYRLPPRWIVIAAGNRPSDLADQSKLTDDPILWNRFAHVNYEPTITNWIKWSLNKPTINPELVAFLQFHKHFYHRYDPDSKRANWPSPRTWAMASEEEYHKRGEDWSNKLTYEKIRDIYMDFVGRDASLDFIEYLKLKAFYSEKDIKDVYEIGDKAKRVPDRLDQSRAAAVSIAFYKKGEKLTTKELKNILDFSMTMNDMETRLALVTFLRLVHPYIKEESPWKEIYFEWVKGWHKLDIKKEQ